MSCLSWDLLLRRDVMQLCRGVQGLWMMVGTGKLHLSYEMERWVCGHVSESLHFPAGWGGLRHRRCGGPLVGVQSILSSRKLLKKGKA